MPDLKSFCGIILLLTLLTCPPLMAQTFTDASQLLHPMAPIEGGFQKGASAADFNNDGLVDIYHPNGNQVGRLYLNRGEAGFFDILPEIGLVEGARLWGAAFGDFDNDAYLDILFEDFSAPSRLYKNNRNWSFTQFNDRANVSIPSLAQGAGWGDFNLDGKLDLMVVNDAGAKQLFKNLTFATFAEVTQSANVQTFGNSYGMSWGDLNNDGYLDLFVTNTSNQKNGLYHNNGDGTFTKITAGEIVNEEFSSMGCTWGDYDADGDLDLFVANLSSSEKNLLFANNGQSNHWFAVKCVGTRANTSAIGTKVSVQSKIKGTAVWQMREISGQTGFAAQNSLVAVFGLADAAEVDSVKIAWPSGTVQYLPAVAADQFLVITEDSTFTGIAGQTGIAPRDFQLAQNYPNPFNPNTTIHYQLATPGEVELAVYNLLGESVRILVREKQSRGTYFVRWDGKNQGGVQVPSGLYVYRLKTEKFTQTRKMLLLR